jgi:hypothetical protein
MTCVGTPISWLRLETYALDKRDAAVAEHVAACPACAACLTSIEGDAIELPRLVVPVAEPRRRWWWIALPAFAVAVVIVLVVRPRPPEARDDIAYGVKGVGDVVLGVVRERAGTIRDDVHTYAPGDRWKVVVTCPPAARAWIDVAVVDPAGVDYPLAPAQVACGNRVVVPGAFAITGHADNRVCVRVAADAAPPRTPPTPGEPNVACMTLRPE